MLRLDAFEVAKRCAPQSYILVELAEDDEYVEYISSQPDALFQMAVLTGKFDLYQLVSNGNGDPMLVGIPLTTGV